MAGFTLTTAMFIGTKGFIQIENLRKQVKIRNFKKDFLVAQPEESTATFESEGFDEESGKFVLDTYRELAGQSSKDAIPVIISYEGDNQTYLLCVADNSVILTEGEVPEEIPEESSEFIFYQRDSISEHNIFESSVKSGFCLAVDEDGQSLILEPFSEEEHNETTMFKVDKVLTESFIFHPKLKKTYQYNFRNINNDLLFAHQEEHIATYQSGGQAQDKQASFYVNTYYESALNNGLPVVITYKDGNKNYILCAASNSVILQESELPDAIPTNTSELIFYVKDFTTGQSSPSSDPPYMLESSCNPGHCLAWNLEDSKKQLILKPYSEGVIDETLIIFLGSPN